MAKIIDVIKQAEVDRHPFFAFEYVASVTDGGTMTLYDRIDRMSSLDPLFCGITCDSSAVTAEISAEIAVTCQSLLAVNYQVAVTCIGRTKEEMYRWLSLLKGRGIRNVLATRGCGDGLHQQAENTGSDFPHAVDLVRFIRHQFDDYFSIAVTAYPEGHNTSSDLHVYMGHLKEKVDAGADYIITQTVFDADVYADFCTRCRERGIWCPVLPTVASSTPAALLNGAMMRDLSGVEELKRRMHSVGYGTSGAKRMQLEFLRDLIQQLFRRGAIGVYMFTFNAESDATAIIRGLNLTVHRAFPWKLSENEERRSSETVRPIHWCLRVASYMARTAQWKNFRVGGKCDAALACPTIGDKPQRQGDAGSNHVHLFLRSRARRCTQFLSLIGMADIPTALSELSRIFVNFLNGIGTLPWAVELFGETASINEVILKPLNARGLFTINSQPQVNGAPSSDRVFGWGPPDGFIYQKCYLEFFCPVSLAQTIFTTLEKYPSLQYMAMNSGGKLVNSHWRPCTTGSSGGSLLPPMGTPERPSFFNHVTALSWGVFPGREIIQPTIVSQESFHAWVGEAFELWAAPFPSNDIPPVVHIIQTEWLLLSVVDNAYQGPSSAMEQAMEEVCSKIPPLIPKDASRIKWPIEEEMPISRVD